MSIELQEVNYAIPASLTDTPWTENHTNHNAGQNGAEQHEPGHAHSGGEPATPAEAEPRVDLDLRRRTILHDISFVVPEKSITCIMGVSGTGKTTLLRLIAGLLKPSSGKILIDEQDIVPMTETQLKAVRLKTGFVFQYGALFDSLTIAENVGFGLARQRRPQTEIDEVVEQRLLEVGLSVEQVGNRLPSELSGGMRKRVAMARALATNPSMVLYDEPTSGLDPVMGRIIDDLIVNLRDRSGATSIVVSHSLSSILRISDHIIMLNGPRIVANGSPDEIRKSQSPVVRQFLEGRATGPITVH